MTRQILYVDNNPLSYRSFENQRAHERRQQIIRQNLEEYAVRLVHDLHSPQVDAVLQEEHFDAFLAHLPYNRVTYTYDRSLARLESLLAKYPLSTIVYTGAEIYSVSDERLLGIPNVKAIVRKTSDQPEKDAKEVKKVLARILHL